MCLFPKHYFYNDNEPEQFPFQAKAGGWELDKPNEKFWTLLEDVIDELGENGIQCDLILFHPYDKWGFSKFTREEALTYLTYAVRRLAPKKNIWWSLANEYDAMEYEDDDWSAFADCVKENDMIGHLLSIHNMIRPWDFSDERMTHISLQLPNVDELALDFWHYGKPIVVDECKYEGNIPMDWGNLSGFEMVDRFWKTAVQGGYCTHGETFADEKDILWWAKGGCLKGESPARIAFFRNIMEELPVDPEFMGTILSDEQVEEFRKNPPKDMAANPVFKSALKLENYRMRRFIAGKDGFVCRCGDEVFIHYYSRQNTITGVLQLPDTATYDVEVIDVWDMTRTKVLSGVSGMVFVPMAGKEGLAVLAKKCEG